MHIFLFLFYIGNFFVSSSSKIPLEIFSIQLFHRNYFSPYYICNDIEQNTINKICYDLNTVTTYNNMVMWSGSSYVSYNYVANNIQISSYLYLFKVKDLPECFISYVVNNHVKMDDIYNNKPLLLYNNIEENFIWSVNTIKDLDQIKIIQIKKEVIENIFDKQVYNHDTLQYENKRFSQKIKKYHIVSIRDYDKVFLLDLFNKLMLYTIGMMIKTQDLVNLKHAAIEVFLGDIIEYHIVFYSPHDYGECTNIVNFRNPCVIYFVFVINKNNIIENIKLKTQCCEKFDI